MEDIRLVEMVGIGNVFGSPHIFMSSWLKGIAVSTSSGKVSFLFIEHSKEIHDLLRQLLIDRQDQKNKSQNTGTFVNNADELKKYKELLDGGVITQEEFETKKKQLLNM